MKKLVTLCVLLLVATVLSGCPMVVDIVLYNHTGKDLLVQVEDKRISVSQESMKTIRYPGNAPLITVTAGETVWQYDLKYLPDEKLLQPKIGGIAGYEVYYQIQPDGIIYVVPPGNRMPVDVVPPQPSGFPLMPLKSGA